MRPMVGCVGPIGWLMLLSSILLQPSRFIGRLRVSNVLGSKPSHFTPPVLRLRAVRCMRERIGWIPLRPNLVLRRMIRAVTDV